MVISRSFRRSFLNSNLISAFIPPGEGTRVSQHFHFMPQGKMNDRVEPESAAEMQAEEVAFNLNRLKGILEGQIAQG